MKSPVMKVGRFINTQFPEGFSVAETGPKIVTQCRSRPCFGRMARAADENHRMTDSTQAVDG
jgi:hypothetical protein